MKIPETPGSVSELDLMKRLEAYAEGKETWEKSGALPGPHAKQACRTLHTNIVNMVEKVLAPIMDRSTAKELDTFTMHDRVHGRKVAHLMWHILTPDRQRTLTPPEIGMLVLAAHLHDAGMALSNEERQKRLAPQSDLWDRVEASPTIKRNLKRLRDMLADANLAESKRVRIENELFQAEEALLALDTRERHALRDRYEEIISQLRSFHLNDPTKIPNVEECFSFDGDSFRKKLIDICVSHNEDADALVERDAEQFDRPRFPRDYPVGLTVADTHMTAAALRLADILDFDRERTPPTLFHYLVPSSLSHSVNISELEWGKHLSISNWEIDQSAVVFRGRCKNHIVHHAVVQFCRAIEEEIASSRATFKIGDAEIWPFILPEAVRADIHEDGYHYVPYQFELDDSRVYELLMGRAIYDNPLVAVRELIQNAVDACSYRDALSKLAESNHKPDTQNRITVRYEEPTVDKEYPILRVIDTGTGMDGWLIERWFLKVGRSFYNSTEFARDRAQMRKGGVDFAPVSEFGIGFLSCFLLADRVDIETAMWEPLRGDTRKREMEIDGPTRLIRIRESKNEGLKRLRGTQVSLTLIRGGITTDADAIVPPTWAEIKRYLEYICQGLPYRVNLEHRCGEVFESGVIDAHSMSVYITTPFDDQALRIPVLDEAEGLEGEIAIVPKTAITSIERERFEQSNVYVETSESRLRSESVLIRGGFAVGEVPGLPSSGLGGGRIRMLWRASEGKRYSSTNLARTSAADKVKLGNKILEIWIRYLIDHRQELRDGFLNGMRLLPTPGYSPNLRSALWLENYDALTLYSFARSGWQNEEVASWEDGRKPIELRTGSDLCDHLLGLVLPHVVPMLEMRAGEVTRIMPPVPQWREILQSCRDFVSKPVRWQLFAVYRDLIEDSLFHASSGLLNQKYKGRLTDFSDSELRDLPKLLGSLVRNREAKRPAALSENQFKLLDKLIDTVGELNISNLEYRDFYEVRVNSFRQGAK
jgi:hypothetical protein